MNEYISGHFYCKYGFWIICKKYYAMPLKYLQLTFVGVRSFPHLQNGLVPKKLRDSKLLRQYSNPCFLYTVYSISVKYI